MIIRVYRLVKVSGSVLRGELVHEERVETLPDLEELKDQFEADYVEVELED